MRCIARRGVRGLRVQEVTREAGVSPGLLYYHFGDRAGLLAAALVFVSDRAARYTADSDEQDPVAQIRHALLAELQDRADVIENSSAWGELRASAIFEPALQAPLAAATQEWNEAITELVVAAQRRGTARAELHPGVVAAMLTALVEGLSNRWLSGSLVLADARLQLSGAIAHILLD